MTAFQKLRAKRKVNQLIITSTADDVKTINWHVTSGETLRLYKINNPVQQSNLEKYRESVWRYPLIMI